MDTRLYIDNETIYCIVDLTQAVCKIEVHISYT